MIKRKTTNLETKFRKDEMYVPVGGTSDMLPPIGAPCSVAISNWTADFAAQSFPSKSPTDSIEGTVVGWADDSIDEGGGEWEFEFQLMGEAQRCTFAPDKILLLEDPSSFVGQPRKTSRRRGRRRVWGSYKETSDSDGDESRCFVG